MSSEIQTPTKEHRSIWEQKKVLRMVYGDYYRRISDWCVEGNTLEVGGGSGNFASFHNAHVVSMDIQELPWLDLVGDAHRLPFCDEAFSNIVLVDTLHHLQKVPFFLEEALRILSPGGRLIMIEPAISPISYIVYNYMHPEPVIMDDDPLAQSSEPLNPDRDPFDSNQAIPSLLFELNMDRFKASYPELKPIECTRFSLYTLVLSGGLRSWSLMPPFIVPLALRLEDVLTPALRKLMGFRLLVVLERQ
jgi:SAM-dependent methyltransferase